MYIMIKWVGNGGVIVLDVILDAFIDVLKLIPFLFIAFLILEYIEHKMSKKNSAYLINNRKIGPVVGGLLGAFPQCGFSAMATKFFSSRVITLGTLIAVYLSTSDEMLPLLISNGVNIIVILKIVGIKLIIGIIFGFLIDLIYHKKENFQKHIHDMCMHDDCHCEKGLLKSSIHHTLQIAFYLLIITLFINILIYFVGEDNISNFLLQKNILSYFLASLVGLIPNCASSVIITELYLNQMISIGSMFSGLLTGCGVGVLILFKTNKHIKENIAILLIIYMIGVICGGLIDLLGVTI